MSLTIDSKVCLFRKTAQAFGSIFDFRGSQRLENTSKRKQQSGTMCDLPGLHCRFYSGNFTEEPWTVFIEHRVDVPFWWKGFANYFCPRRPLSKKDDRCPLTDVSSGGIVKSTEWLTKTQWSTTWILLVFGQAAHWSRGQIHWTNFGFLNLGFTRLGSRLELETGTASNKDSTIPIHIMRSYITLYDPSHTMESTQFSRRWIWIH